ncbi:MAG: hypothetical protein NTX69_05230 [Candidatus Bipolaricaulota bacterium]|nr:hypothetical protein [Candidatus Bipolaricaulota bacterium]
MKGKAVRIVLVVALLGALAAIPASTQGLLGHAQSSSDETGVDLPMVLLVNRLELSRQQMETLLSTINRLLGQTAVLDQKRDAFEQEMIAFSGTAEELNVRLAAFQTEMKTARTALDDEVAAAISTLKDTLTMKQGEILTAAFPGILGRLDAASPDSTRVAPQAQSADLRATVAGQNGRAMMRRGQASMTSPSGQTAPEPTQGSIDVAGKIQTMVDRIRERVADRLTGAAMVAPSAGAACPMAGMMMSASGGPVSGQVGVFVGGSEGSDDFGTVTISLSDSGSPASVGVRGGERRFVSWLDRFAQVLELKLAAMK